MLSGHPHCLDLKSPVFLQQVVNGNTLIFIKPVTMCLMNSLNNNVSHMVHCFLSPHLILPVVPTDGGIPSE